jgi:hypothetical protein
LQNSLSDLLGCLMQARINDLKTGIAQGAGNRLGPTVMAI